jgi:hypothetical protein
VPFALIGSGIGAAVVDGVTYLRLETDASKASRTESGATDMTASTGPWVDVPGVPKHPKHGGAFKFQLNAGYRVPKGSRT